MDFHTLGSIFNGSPALTLATITWRAVVDMRNT